MPRNITTFTRLMTAMARRSTRGKNGIFRPRNPSSGFVPGHLPSFLISSAIPASRLCRCLFSSLIVSSSPNNVLFYLNTGLVTLKYRIPVLRGNSSCIQIPYLFVILYGMIEFEKITTRGGDFGETSIADGSRRPKDDLLIDVLGEVDELHAIAGFS